MTMCFNSVRVSHDAHGREVRECSICGKPLERFLPDGKKVNCLCNCQDRDNIENDARAKDDQRRHAAFGRRVMPTFDQCDQKGVKHAEACKRYCEQFGDFEKNGEGLLFFGPPDQGKTFLAGCIASEVFSRRISVAMVTAPEIVRADYDEIDRLVSVRLLVIDDLGAERDSSYGLEKVYTVIDGRYSAKRPMVVTTNLGREELHNGGIGYGRITSRLLERCLPLEIDCGRRRASAEHYGRMREKLGITIA